MLSSEHPSGPSCSSKSAAPGVRADPATSAAEVPTCQDPRDLVQPCPKFSIRDYVFSSRSKGVKRSWPFHPNSLQLCLKRGVKDPLPPFEPPDFIRSPPFNTFTNLKQSAARSEAISCVGLVKVRDAGSSNVDTSDINFQSSQPVDDSSLGPSHVDTSDINFQSSQPVDDSSLGPSPCTSPEDGKSGTDQVGSTNESDHTDGVIPVYLQDNSWANASRRTEVAGPLWRSKNLESSCETSQKKCKLVVKSGTLTDTRRMEDIASNCSSVSDPMASKTCPVCKVFASTSNTTLNAHIDQCLSVESNTELVETVRVKPKVKTRKNNTLSAHIDHCLSVESNSELVETVLVMSKVKPKKKRLMVDIYKTALPYTLEDLDRRNGTNWATELAIPTVNNEVCTENRSPEMPPFDAKDDEREGDVYVDSNGIKIRILSKCSDAPLVLSDGLGTKKVPKHETGKGILMKKKIWKSKILKNKKLKMHGKKYNKMLNSQVQAHGGINEDTTEGEMHSQNPTESTSHHGPGTMRQWVCSKRSDVSKNVSKKLSDKPFDKVASGAQKLVRNSMLSFDSYQVRESPAGIFSSEPPEEMGTTTEANGVEQSNARLLRLSSQNPLQNYVLPKVPRSAAAIAKRKIREIGRREANKSDSYDTIKNSSSVKRSVARSSFSVAGPSNGPNRLASMSKKFRKQRSVLRTGRRAFSPSDNGLVRGFGQDNEPDTIHVSKKSRLTGNSTLKKFVKHTEEEEDTADNDSSFGSDIPLLGQHDNQYDTAQQTEGIQTDYGCEEPETDTPYASVSRNGPADSCNEISYGSLSPENDGTDHDILVEEYAVGVEDPGSSEQVPNCANESNNVANNEIDEWQMDPASTKESSACLTNNRDVGPGAPQDNSSITSNREDSNQEHGLPFGRDSLDSPVSTASTMSPTALKDSRSKESEPGPSTVRTTEEGTSGSLNQETKSTPMARDGEQLSNEKPLCCSCRGSISRESQLHNQSEITRPRLNFSGKQVPQLHIGLTASSSFSTYQRTNTKVNPFLDSLNQPSATKISAESSMNLPSYTTDCMSPSLQTQLPSPSNPILRLMGKNLMVMNNEESVQPPAPSSEYILRGNFVSPVGFVSPSYQHPNDSAFMNTAPAIANHQIPLPSVQTGNFVGPPLHISSLVQQSDLHSQQKSYRNRGPVMRHPTYTMKEVIVIDDSPERRSEPQVSMLHPSAPSTATVSVPNTTGPRPFYCLPPTPILPRERSAGSLPVYANVDSMVGVNSSSQASKTEVANPYMRNPFFVHPQTGYINSPVYYSQNLRR